MVFGEDGMCHGGGMLHSADMSRDKRLQDRSIYPHWCTDTVRFSDQDAAGHINNVALCAYLETARLTFIRDMGMMARRRRRRARHLGRHDGELPGRIALAGPGRAGHRRDRASAPAPITVGSAAFKDGACIAAAEMTVVRLKGKTPHPIDAALRTKLEKYLLYRVLATA